MNVPFKKNITDSRKSKYAFTIILLGFYFANKLLLSSAGAFHKNSLIVPCCIFGKLEIRTLTPNRFKNQTNDTLKLLNCNSNINKVLLYKKCYSPSCWIIGLLWTHKHLVQCCFNFV